MREKPPFASESFMCSRCQAGIARAAADGLGKDARLVKPSSTSSFIHHARLQGRVVTFCGLRVDHDRLARGRDRVWGLS